MKRFSNEIIRIKHNFVWTAPEFQWAKDCFYVVQCIIQSFNYSQKSCSLGDITPYAGVSSSANEYHYLVIYAFKRRKKKPFLQMVKTWTTERVATTNLPILA